MFIKNILTTISKIDKIDKITLRGEKDLQITTGYGDRIHFNFEEIISSIEKKNTHIINDINLDNPFLQDHDVDIISRAIIKSSHLNHSFDKYSGWIDINISPETENVIIGNIKFPVKMIEGESIKTKINIDIIKEILNMGINEILFTIGKQGKRLFSFIATNFDSCLIQIIMLEE